MIRILTFFALLLAVTGALAGSAAAVAAPAATVRLQTLDGEILVRLNATRVSRGLRPLVLSSQLRDAAVAHSRSMLEGGFFTHESRDGSPFVARVKRYYRSSGYASWSAGENLLYNTARIDARAAIEAWLGSPPHRANMLAPGWREVGIGSLHARSAGGTFGGRPTWVVTIDFGTRAGGRKTAAVEAARAKPSAAAPAPAKARPPRPKAAKPTRPSKRFVVRVLPQPARSAPVGAAADEPSAAATREDWGGDERDPPSGRSTTFVLERDDVGSGLSAGD